MLVTERSEEHRDIMLDLVEDSGSAHTGDNFSDSESEESNPPNPKTPGFEFRKNIPSENEMDMQRRLAVASANCSRMSKDGQSSRTKQAYDSYQQIFKSWCNKTKCTVPEVLRYVVDKDTMFLFLSDMQDSDTTLASKKEHMTKRIENLKRPVKSPSKDVHSIIGIISGDEETEEDAYDLESELDPEFDGGFKIVPNDNYNSSDDASPRFVAERIRLQRPEDNNGDLIPRLRYNSQNREMVEHVLSLLDPNEEYYETTHEKRKYFGTKGNLVSWLTQIIPSRPIGYSTMEGLCNAVKDLYSQQNPHANANADLHTTAVKTLLDNVKKRENIRAQAMDKCPQIGSLKDGYLSEKDMERCTRYFFQLDLFAGLRWLLAFTLCHYCLLRGGMFRNLNLSHLFLLHTPFKHTKQSATGAPTLCLVIRDSKTNKKNYPQVFSCLRNKNVKLCAHSAMAFYFVYMFHIAKRNFPNLENFRNWGLRKLVPKTFGGNEEESVSYETHAGAMRRAFAYLCIITSKLTHIGRRSGAFAAQMLGAALVAIKQAGGWEEGAVEKSYLAGINLEVNKVLAGFSAHSDNYYIPRDTDISSELLEMIFPEVEEYSEDFSKLDISAQSFIELCKYLRKVFIQDAPALMEIYPDNPLWDLPIFKTDLFNAFKERQATAMNHDPTAAELTVSNAMPSLHEYISASDTEMTQCIKGGFAQMQLYLAESRAIASYNQKMTNHRFDCVLRYLQIIGRLNSDLSKLTEEEKQEVSDLADRVFQFEEEAESIELQPPQKRVCVRNSTSASQDKDRGQSKRTGPRFEFPMCPGVTTVKSVWDEYVHGTNGNPPIRELENTNQKYWDSKNNAEITLRKRRLKIVDFIKKTAEKLNCSEDCSADTLNKWFVTRRNYGLSTFAKDLFNNKAEPSQKRGAVYFNSSEFVDLLKIDYCVESLVSEPETLDH